MDSHEFNDYGGGDIVALGRNFRAALQYALIQPQKLQYCSGVPILVVPDHNVDSFSHSDWMLVENETDAVEAILRYSC
jgi:hypothetical protein